MGARALLDFQYIWFARISHANDFYLPSRRLEAGGGGGQHPMIFIEPRKWRGEAGINAQCLWRVFIFQNGKSFRKWDFHVVSLSFVSSRGTAGNAQQNI